jgi:hypothetical protein
VTTETIRRGRPSASDLTRRLLAERTAADELRLELRAAGHDMRAAGHALQYADRVGRRDLTLHTAASLIVRGERYARS